jgi:hypothetical protein
MTGVIERGIRVGVEQLGSVGPPAVSTRYRPFIKDNSGLYHN